LIFRKTGLDDEKHIAFAQQLGQDLEINPFFYGIEKDRIGNPLLWDVSKYAKLDICIENLTLY
jgi:alpha-ketoglutarate-dependent 2,4-dichlorophenoxyacetate dioxygenase